MKWTTRPLLLTGGTIAILAGAAWWGYATWSVDPLAGILTADVVVADIERAVLASGTLRPVKLVAVGAQVSGRVTAMKVELGQTVKKGDLVAEIDDVNQQNALKKANASLDSVRAQLQEKKASLVYAQAALAREELTLAEKASSRDAYEVARTAVATTRYQIAALDAQIVEAEVAVNTAEVSLAYTRIVAPQDGTVLLVVTQEGQTVNAAQSAPTIVVLGQVDHMTVRAEVSEADVIGVKPGLPVWFTILGDLDARWDATLASLDPAPDSIRSDNAIASSATSSSSSSSSSTSAAVYYYGRFDVPNPEGRLRTYMTAQVHIVLGAAKGVLTIPTSALSPAGKGARSVEVVDADGTITRRVVTVGLDDKVRVEILTGLKAGERVVASRKAAGAAPHSSSGQMRRAPGGL